MKRDLTLDTAKGLLIVFVLIGHICADYNATIPLFNTITIYIYIFHMPCFIFISGYLSKKLSKNRERSIKNFSSFVLFQFLWLLFCLIVHRYDQYSNFLIPGSALWYLIALSVWRYILEDLIKFKYIFLFSIFFGTLIIGILTPMPPILGITRIIGFLPFFLLGYYFDEEKLKKIKKINKFISILYFILLFVLAYFMYVSKIDFLKLLSHNYQYKEIMVNNDLLLAIFINFLSYIVSFMSIMFFINISSIFKCKIISNRFGQNTLPIYILSNYIQYIFFMLAAKYLYNFDPYLKYLISIIVTIFTLFLCSNKYVIKIFNLIQEKFYKLILK